MSEFSKLSVRRARNTSEMSALSFTYVRSAVSVTEKRCDQNLRDKITENSAPEFVDQLSFLFF